MFRTSQKTSRRRTRSAVETLEARALLATVSIDVNQVVRTVPANFLGADIPAYDDYLSANHDGSGVTPDAQTVALIENAGLTMLRISNGTGADEWHFSSNANEFNDSAGLLANVAAAAGTDGLVTVNYGTGTPQEAAAYLAYLNGSTNNQTVIGKDVNGTDWGTAAEWATLRGQTPIGGDPLDGLRAGHPAPFGFTDFEVGNEVYFALWNGAPPHVDPAAYVAFAKKFAQYAQQIDPSVSIGVDVGNPVEWDTLWNGPMLQQCAAQGFTPGFLSDHFYVYDGTNETVTDQQLLEHSVTDPNSVMPNNDDAPRNWAGRAADYQALLTQTLGAAGANVRLICAEFNSDAAASNKQSTNLVHGLFVADAIGGVLQTPYDAVVSWDLRNFYNDLPDNPSYYGWRTGSDNGLLGSPNGTAPATGPYVAYPAYFALELASKMVHAGDTVVQATSDNVDLAAYAVVQQDGHLALLVVNKSASASINETFDVTGFTPRSAADAWQYGKAEDTAQSHTADGSASLTASTPNLAVTANGDGGQFQMTFPAYSMTVLDLAPAVAQDLHLVLNAQPPASVVAGATFPLAVTAKDLASNGVVTTYDGPVTVSLLSGPTGAVLGGTQTVAGASGVFTFPNLTLNKAGGGYVLQFSGPGIGAAQTQTFSVTPAAATHLSVTTQPPSSVTAGAAFGLVADALDGFGNVDTNFNGSVTASLLNNPGGSTLGGTHAVAAQAGVVTFAGLTLDNAGTGYTLRLTGTGLAPVDTNPFNVAAGSAAVPAAPQLDPGSDTGVSATDGVTRDNGSAAAPLTFTVGGVVPANGFVQLYDATNPAAPVALGSPVQAAGGIATITLNGAALADGVHPIAAAASATVGGAQSNLSEATAVTILTSLRVNGISPSADFVPSLPDNRVVVTFNHALVGLTPDDSTGLGFTSAPFSVMLIPSGPDGGALFAAHASSLWTAPSGVDDGDLPVPATLVYHENADGTATVTLTPNQPLATDIYLVSVGGLSDLAGNAVADSQGHVGTVYTSFDLRPTPIDLSALRVTSVTAQNGTVPIADSAIAQPDTIGIAFNKPLDTWTVNTGTVHLLAQTGAGQFQPVAAAVAYSPTTDTVYLTPEATLSPGVTYLVQVDPTVTDDQGFPNPGVPLGQPFFTTFQVRSADAGAGAGTGTPPFRVSATSPADGTAWSFPLGYGAVTFSTAVDMSSLGRFSAMLVPQTGGVTTGGSGYADVPVNAKVAFNPNTNQLIIVPTGLLPNDTVFLFSMGGMKAADGSDLVGGTEYATFLWNGGTPAHVGALESRNAPLVAVPATGTDVVAPPPVAPRSVVLSPRPGSRSTPAVRVLSRVPTGPLRVKPGDVGLGFWGTGA